MKLTDEQLDIIDTAKNLKSTEILKIEACAGSGKTSTLIAITEELKNFKFLYLAFNREIVNSIKSKVGPNVDVMTTHSLAFQNVYSSKLKNLKLVSKLNAIDLKRIGVYNFKEQKELLTKFNEFLHSSSKDVPSEIKPINKAIFDGVLPVTHDFYLKIFQLSDCKVLNRYDYILLDEAQDTNEVTLDIFLKPSIRKILVGDSRQAIYSWRGAINALDKVSATYTKALSNTFRCNEEIVDKVNQLSKYYENFIPLKSKFIKNAKYTEAIISRTNSYLIKVISNLTNLSDYRLIKNPDEIFEKVFNIRKLKNFEEIKNPFFKNFKNLNHLKNYARTVEDVELLTAIKIENQFSDRLNKLYENAQALFYNEKGFKFLTNAHQSKGLEFTKVLICNDFPTLDNDTDIEEINLMYVAYTRASEILEFENLKS